MAAGSGLTAPTRSSGPGAAPGSHPGHQHSSTFQPGENTARERVGSPPRAVSRGVSSVFYSFTQQIKFRVSDKVPGGDASLCPGPSGRVRRPAPQEAGIWQGRCWAGEGAHLSPKARTLPGSLWYLRNRRPVPASPGRTLGLGLGLASAGRAGPPSKAPVPGAHGSRWQRARLTSCSDWGRRRRRT